MHAARYAAPFLIVAILVGCGAEDSTAPPKQIVAPRFDLIDPSSGPSASGHANFFNRLGEYGSRSFSAHEAGGVVRGNFVQHTTAPTGEKRVNKGDIDCLRIVPPNVAVLSGPVHEHILPALIGQTQIFSVQDNGEGSDSPPEMVSNLTFVDPSSAVNCENFTPTVMFVVLSGNVQVKP